MKTRCLQLALGVLALALVVSGALSAPVGSAYAAPLPPPVGPEVKRGWESTVAPVDRTSGSEQYAAAYTAWSEIDDNDAVIAEQDAQSSPDPALKGEGVTESDAADGPAAGLAAGKEGNGKYTATPLSEASSWQAGASSGSFGWSFPFRLPPAAAGPAPKLAISYDSGSVDGRTFTTNNQPSAVGEGFELTTSYVQRSFGTCHNDGHADGQKNKVDQCWRGERLRLVLNGQASELVQDGVNNDKFRLEQDNGTLVERKDGASNGDNDGEFWQVTTPDGSTYQFGRHRLPGWQAGAPVTSSTWTVPVYTDDGNDPARAQVCKKATLAESWCQQAWRWNLDLITDPSGNAATLWYDAEVNHYARFGKEDVNGTAYERGGNLSRVDYGLRSDNIFNGTAVTPAPQQVDLGYRERCLDKHDLEALAEDRCSSLVGAKRGRWPDVPFDSICAADKECKEDPAPTFFTRKRLATVLTKVRDGSGGYRNVDRWTIKHTFVDPGDVGDTTDQILWPKSIQHRGLAGTEIVKRPVYLIPTIDEEMRNRVDTDSDGIAPLIRPRLGGIISETGALTDVTYSAPQCNVNNLPSPSDNGMRCFPVRWTPYFGELMPTPKLDWFHKYVVTSVRQVDTTEARDLVTSYAYEDPGWAFAEDSLTANPYRTWSEWRGYRKVHTMVGAPDGPERTKSTAVYYRGLDGKNVVGIDAPTVPDKEELAGQLRETVVYNGVKKDGTTGAMVGGTITTPWSEQTVSQQHPGGTMTYLDAQGETKTLDVDAVTVKAFRTDTQTTTSRTRVSSGTPFVRSVTTQVKVRDALGYPTEVANWATPNEAEATTRHLQCTRHWYAHNTGANVLGLKVRTQVLSKPCADAAVLPPDSTTPGDVVSDEITRYDGAQGWQNQTPTAGLVTMTQRVPGYNADRTPKLQTVSTTTYDALGRPKTVADATGATTTTDYFPTGAGVPDHTVVTDALDYKTTTYVDPAWGADTKTVDPNELVIEKTYDALGRLTAVWTPQSNRADGGLADVKFDYHLGGARDANGYVDESWVSTSTIKSANDGYVTSYEIFDALLRPRQTQSPSAYTGRVMTDTVYNDRGQVAHAFRDIWEPDNPQSGVRVVAEGNNAVQTSTVYDGANRPTTVTEAYTAPAQNADGSTRRSRVTKTSYTGDAVATEAPAGGMATSTITDVLGRTVERRQYAGATPTGSFEATKFGYDEQRRESSVTGPDGAAWTYDYDLFGRQTVAVDPDSGTTSTAYNALDQVQRTKDALNRNTSYVYDKLGRKIATYAGVSVTDPTMKQASWNYDDVQYGIGQLASSTRFVSGETGPRYVRSITKYDKLQRPVESQLTLPNTNPLTTVGGVPETLTFGSEYNRDGTLRWTDEPAVGGLPSEKTATTYDARGLGLAERLTGRSDLVIDTQYDALGDVARTTLAQSEADTDYQRAWISEERDGLRRTTAYRGLEWPGEASTELFDLEYSYNDAGQISQIADVAAPPLQDLQCFTYGGYQRLQEAWTPKTNSCDPAGRTKTNIGGAAPYWHSYAYKTGGGRSSWTDQPITSTDTAVTTTYEYGGTCAVGGAALGPHVLRSTTGGGSTKQYCATKLGETTTSYNSGGAERATTWNREGKLETATVGTTKYEHIYDADGQLLIKRPTDSADGVTTLYLGATEVQMKKTTISGTAGYDTSARRYFTFNGDRIAVRKTKAGATGWDLTFLAGDHHGTVNASWEGADFSKRTKRFHDPFGGSRGTNPAWPDDKRFLGMSHDWTLGLTHIGAREYDPKLGRFLTVDPVLDRENGQSLNGYTYAGNDPINNSDPTGMYYDADGPRPTTGGGGGGGGDDEPRSEPEYDPALSELLLVPLVMAEVNRIDPKSIKYPSLPLHKPEWWIEQGADVVTGALMGGATELSKERAKQLKQLRENIKMADGAEKEAFRKEARPKYGKPGKKVAIDYSRMERDAAKKLRMSRYMARGAGIGGVFIAGAQQYSEDDEYSTGQRLTRAGLKGGFVVAGATMGATLGAACVPGAIVCSTVLGAVGGTVGAVAGDWTANFVLENFW